MPKTATKDSKKKVWRKRGTSPHPGVILRQRSRTRADGSTRTTWFARWTDADTGKAHETNLDAVDVTNRDERRKWAVAKSGVIQARRAEIASGAPRRTQTPLADALNGYLLSRGDLRPRTKIGYQETVEFAIRWAKEAGLDHVEELTPAHLSQLRAWLVALPSSRIIAGRTKPPKRKPRKPRKGNKGRRVKLKTPRSPGRVNLDLRQIRAILNGIRPTYLRGKITRDDIVDNMKLMVAPSPKPQSLTPAECRELIEAAIRHDGAKGTRTDWAAWFAFVLLTGCRKGEARTLLWKNLDLDATDEKGDVIGMIRMVPSAVKTNTERHVYLDVSPGLLAVLRRMYANRKGSYVFTDADGSQLTNQDADNWRGSLMRRWGAPSFTYQRLRQTCASYLVSASGIYGHTSMAREAAQLGHDPATAKKHYTRTLPGLDKSASTLDELWGVSDLLERIPTTNAISAAG